MKSVVPVCTAVPVEISDSVHWNAEIQHQPHFKLPIMTTDAPRRKSVTNIRSDIHCDNDTLGYIWPNSWLLLVLCCEEKAWTWNVITDVAVQQRTCEPWQTCSKWQNMIKYLWSVLETICVSGEAWMTFKSNLSQSCAWICVRGWWTQTAAVWEIGRCLRA